MTVLIVKGPSRRTQPFGVQFVDGNCRVVEERGGSAATAGDAIDIINRAIWPPRAVVARVLDVEGGVAYEICKADFR